jgi:hypothetical protein
MEEDMPMEESGNLIALAYVYVTPDITHGSSNTNLSSKNRSSRPRTITPSMRSSDVQSRVYIFMRCILTQDGETEAETIVLCYDSGREVGAMR